MAGQPASGSGGRKFYPLRLVISRDVVFSSLYNARRGSIGLISECLRAEQASKLLDAGAQFDVLVLLNGEGEELAERVAPRQGDDPQLGVRVERLRLRTLDENAVETIHKRLRSPGARSLFPGRPTARDPFRVA